MREHIYVFKHESTGPFHIPGGLRKVLAQSSDKRAIANRRVPLARVWALLLSH